jgi:type III secretion protein V
MNLEVPGRRIEAVNQAICALEQASNLAPEGVSYREQLEKLRKRKSLITYFGERAMEMPMPVVTPIVLEIAGDLIPYVEGKEETKLSPLLEKLTKNLRKRIFREMGVKIPGIRFRGNEDLAEGNYVIMLMESPVIRGQILQGKRLFPGSLREIAQLEIVAYQKAVNPLTEDEAFWVGEKDWKRVESAKLELWDVIEYPLRHLEAVIRKNLAEFLGHQEVMDLLVSSNCDACNKIQNSNARLTALVHVLQALVTEGVGITAFKAICREFNRLYDAGTETITIAERLRYISGIREKLPGNSREFAFYQLGQHLEAQIHQSIQIDGQLLILNLKPEACQNILRVVRENMEFQKNVAILVDKAELRPFVRELIEIEFPWIPVLSRKELATGLEKNIRAIEPTSTIIDTQKPSGDF